MGQASKRTRHNRTITVDFHNEATYLQLLGNGKAFVECVLAFLLALDFKLAHKATCHGGGCLTRHSHYVRVRLGGVTLWRLQRAASQQELAYRVRGILTDGFDSTVKSMRTLFPGTRRGTCLHHVLLKLPKQ